MKRFAPLIVVGLTLLLIWAAPAQAGEPTGEIGVMNPTMFKCVTKDNTEVTLVQPDPFKKIVERQYTFKRGGEEFQIDRLNEILTEYPNAREETCVNELNVDYGFNPYDAQEFNAYLDKLGRQCREQDPKAVIRPVEDTLIEGYVYEYHPEDSNNPATSDWFGVPSRDVPVRARGITFEIFWGSGEDGYYYFPNLGAGPITLDLQLPPDAHPINPKVVIFSNGLESTWTVFLGFYRGKVAPPNPSQLKTPDGNFLPFVTLSDIEKMSKCGSTELPDVVQSVLPPGTVGTSIAGMPNVGGVLGDDTPSLAVIVLAALLLVALPVAGVVWSHRRD